MLATLPANETLIECQKRRQFIACGAEGLVSFNGPLLTKAIKAEPANPRAFNERAMTLLNLGRAREALSDFDRTCELAPTFPGARAWRARTLRDLGEHRRAAEDWLRELRDHPNGPIQMHGTGKSTRLAT